MALNKDILGLAIYTALEDYNNKPPDDIADMEAFRLAACKVIAHEVIEHFKANAVITLAPLGLVAGVTAVTGTATSTLT